jgi:hypothetical protein
MKPSQIQAVQHVVLEAHPSSRDALIWFYSELAELPCIPAEQSESARRRMPEASAGAQASSVASLCFRSARIELCIVFKDHPRIEQNQRRVLVSVRDLEATVGVLEDREMEYQRISGWGWTDRRVSLIDPGGNRVELKQEWRSGVIGPPKRDQLPSEAETRNWVESPGQVPPKNEGPPSRTATGRTSGGPIRTAVVTGLTQCSRRGQKKNMDQPAYKTHLIGYS